jgi:glycosyltransferase involved in cell wall biosynthesis
VARELRSHSLNGDKPDQFEPTCTVIICTRNHPAELDRCLEGVARLRYLKFDVLVVDNAPTDERAREVAARWNARYITEPVAGLSRARNRGARACDTEIVAFLDDDCVPEPEWLSWLVREFKNPSVMVVTGRVVPLSLQTEAERLSALAGFNSDGHGPRQVDRETPSWFELANFGGIGDGMNMAFRRRAFDVWPGFDERLGRGALIDGAEEHYAFFSLLKDGHLVVYTPYAVIRHPFPRDMKRLRERHLKDLASATAYITFLFAEQPRYRGAVIKYVLEALRGTRREWRGQAAGPRPRIVSRWRMLLAWLHGPLLYVQSCRRRPTAALSCPPACEEEQTASVVSGRPGEP